MSRAVKDAIVAMFNDIAKSKSSIKKILNPSMEGAGLRAFPAKTARNDEKYGLRIDKGEPLAEKPDTVAMKLQINSNAGRKTLRDLAKQAATKENLEKLRDELMDDLDL